MGESSQYGAYIDVVQSLVSMGDRGVEIDVKRFVAALWPYVLPVVVLQVVLKYCEKMGRGTNEAANSIRRFLAAKGFRNQSIGTILLTLAASATTRLDAGADALEILGALLRLAEEPTYLLCKRDIAQLIHRERVLIILDSLESYKIHNYAMKQGLQGIVKAIKEVTADPDLQQIGIRLFTPAEIYEDVAQEIPAKVGSSTVFLRWKFGDLLWMLSTRYYAMLERTGLVGAPVMSRLKASLLACSESTSQRAKRQNLRDDFCYGQGLLPEKIVDALGIREDTFAYLLRHTQRRPRELIFILNQAIRHAYDQSELPRLSDRSIVDGIHADQTLRTLLRDTLSPFEGYLDGIVDRARSAFTGHPRVMTGHELRRFASAMYDLGPVANTTPEDFVTLLMRAGLIGKIDPDIYARAGFCVASFEYLTEDYIPFNKNLMYYVHPLLGDSFRMKRHCDLGVVYPMAVDDEWLKEELGISG